jgi:hypothetical protein
MWIWSTAAALLGSACGASGSGDKTDAGGGGDHAGVGGGGATSVASGGTSLNEETGGEATAAASSGGGRSGSAAGGGGSMPSAHGGSTGGSVSSGNGGSASGAGGVSNGGNVATGGSTASSCPPRPPRCPAKALEGDVLVTDTMPADQVVGVTDIEGALDVADSLGLAAFDCLETVSGQLLLRDGTNDTASFGNAFPNLVSAKDVDAKANFDSQPVDCLFRGLERVQHLSITGSVEGTLDLRALTEFDGIFVQGTDLLRVVLPSNGTFKANQIGFRQNYSLHEVAGFQNVTLTGAPGLTSPYYSLQFQSNPSVSGCRILALAEIFRAAGYVEESIAVGTPMCP